MNAGGFRHRVVIQQRVATKDTFGQQLGDWIDVLSNVPARITPLSGRELISAQAVNAAVTHEIAIRWHRLLVDPVKVASMRVVYVTEDVTRYFNVNAAMDVGERRRQISINATEGMNQG